MSNRHQVPRTTVLMVSVLLLGLVGYGLYFYADRQGWLRGSLPSRPPTAEERARMEEIVRSSNQIAPDAVPGAGVRPPGSTVRELPILEDASSTTELTEEATATTTDVE